jgi:hypothetical protein
MLTFKGSLPKKKKIQAMDMKLLGSTEEKQNVQSDMNILDRKLKFKACNRIRREIITEVWSCKKWIEKGH